MGSDVHVKEVTVEIDDRDQGGRKGRQQSEWTDLVASWLEAEEL